MKLEELLRSKYYKLDETNKPIKCTLLEWSEFIENEKSRKIVKQETVDNKFISTVFLGLDHGYPQWLRNVENYRPKIFETMVFENGDCLESYVDRHSTYDEALLGHQKAVEWVKNGCKEIDLDE